MGPTLLSGFADELEKIAMYRRAMKFKRLMKFKRVMKPKKVLRVHKKWKVKKPGSGSSR